MALNKILSNIKEFEKQVHQKVFSVSQFVGESFVKNARESITKTIYERKPDREAWELTGNLRSSIGYIATSPEGEVKAFRGEKQEGNNEGEKVAESGKPNEGLIMVAGMNYATYVEARGYDVVSNSVEIAKKDFEKLLKKALKI
jgi:hypothetical protein